MKKFFALLLVAGSLVACNNEASSDNNVKDSVQEAIDSIGDTRVDSIKQATDSLQQKVENTFEKTDSANRANADSTNR